MRVELQPVVHLSSIFHPFDGVPSIGINYILLLSKVNNPQQNQADNAVKLCQYSK